MVRRRRLVFALALLCATLSVSCISPCLLDSSGRAPTPVVVLPSPTATPSEAEASRLEEKMASARNGAFHVELTDDELTSYLALRTQDALPLTASRVTFVPGRVMLEGDLTSPIRGHVALSGTIQLVAGKPQVQIDGAALGGIHIPTVLLASISDSVTQVILESTSQIELEQIEIAQGRIVIAGHRR